MILLTQLHVLHATRAGINQIGKEGIIRGLLKIQRLTKRALIVTLKRRVALAIRQPIEKTFKDCNSCLGYSQATKYHPQRFRG